MPNRNEGVNNSEPLQAREEAHKILGQIHGVMWLATKDLTYWLQQTEEQAGPRLTADDLESATRDVHEHFGTMQAALNTGQFDERLVRAGFAGAQGNAKRKGFWLSIKEFFSGSYEAAAGYLSRYRNVLDWSSSLLGSLGAAFEEEIKKVPGAAAAAEATKEFIELLQNAGESNQPKASTNYQGRGRKTTDPKEEA
jgi:hypothetical protein